MDDPAGALLEMVEGAPCVLARWTDGGAITFLNRHGRALFGEPTVATQLFGPLHAILEALRQSTPATSDTTLARPTGPLVLRWHHRRLDADATGAAAIVSVATDVTAYHELAASLASSQRTLTNLADHLEQCVWIKDQSARVSGRMAYVSPAFERIFGIPPERLHGRPDALFDIVHPDDLPRFRAASATQFERAYDIEYRIVRPDGRVRWLWSRAVPVRDGGNRVVRLVGITEDITGRKDAETRIRELNAELAQMVRREQELSRTDELTGLGNRLRFVEEGDRLWLAARREAAATGLPRWLAALVIDVDHFKQINDAHGHPTGDACLQAVARVLRATVREVDVAARVGGDEFIVLLPNTALAPAQQVAERILSALGQAQVDAPGDAAVTIRVAASVGVGAIDGLDATGSLGELQARADEALYAAKQGGRRRVVALPPR